MAIAHSMRQKFCTVYKGKRQYPSTYFIWAFLQIFLKKHTRAIKLLLIKYLIQKYYRMFIQFRNIKNFDIQFLHFYVLTTFCLFPPHGRIKSNAICMSFYPFRASFINSLNQTKPYESTRNKYSA